MSDKPVGSNNITGNTTALRQMAGTAPYDVAPATSGKEVWDGLKQPWSATPQGRLAIRSVSRGVLGAAFYAWGSQKAVKDMDGYDPEKPENGLQHIARAIDKVAGKPLISVLNKVGLNGQEIVSFRPSLEGGARSLGEDAIFNTFDFAMASAGDALGRNVIGLFDPNTEKKWRKEDGKIHFPTALKSLAATTGRIFEAQAEDWFVAIPYTFQQKAQRKLINRISPGFEYTADSTLNGSSFKLDDNGKIVGTYALEGALDLQGRFTGYNFGTAIFRDLSKTVKTKTKELFDAEARENKPPIKITPETMFDAGKRGISGASRYVLNRAIKTTLVMTPSIPVFSLLRIPQNKHRGIGITPEGAQMDLTQNPDFSAYDQTYGKLDAVLNPFGRVANKLSTGAARMGARVAKAKGADENGQDYAGRVADSYVNAAIAYTPYIYAKNEFAHHWDNPHMDTAIYKAIDGVFSGNLKEARAGLREVRHAMKFRDAETVENDKHADKNRRFNFAEKVEKHGKNNGKHSDNVSRKHGASWQEHISHSANENELGNSR